MIAQIDKTLTEQVNLIIHHEDFKSLEGTWRGLHHLVFNTETDEMLKIRVIQFVQEGFGQDDQKLSPVRSGIRVRSSRSSMKKSSARLMASLTVA